MKAARIMAIIFNKAKKVDSSKELTEVNTLINLETNSNSCINFYIQNKKRLCKV